MIKKDGVCFFSALLCDMVTDNILKITIIKI